MPSLYVVVVVLVEIVRSGRLGQSFATLGSRKLFTDQQMIHLPETRDPLRAHVPSNTIETVKLSDGEHLNVFFS